MERRVRPMKRRSIEARQGRRCFCKFQRLILMGIAAENRVSSSSRSIELGHFRAGWRNIRTRRPGPGGPGLAVRTWLPSIRLPYYPVAYYPAAYYPAAEAGLAE